MPSSFEFLWDDENFTIQSGVIPGKGRLSGADLGSGIIYYPVQVNLTHPFRQPLEVIPSPSPAELSFLCNADPEIQIFNPAELDSPFIRVELKPSRGVEDEIPADFNGLVSAALLQEDWGEPFKDSVREDLDAIGALVEPLRSGGTPDPESRERAILAKQDLDLKLLWSAGEYRRLGLFARQYRIANLAASTPATGLINVTVNTKDTANTPVPGCTVWYVSRINHNRTGSYKSFSQFSTPSSEHMAVGNYEMWAERGGSQGSKHVVSVVSASAAQLVDLLAP
jgi:hypothetical protein